MTDDLGDRLPALVLSTTRPARPAAEILIDGHPYRFAILEDLALVDQVRLQRLGERLRALGNLASPETMTDQEAADAADLLATACKLLVVDLPAAVDERLKDLQKIAILDRWNGWNRTRGDA